MNRAARPLFRPSRSPSPLPPAPLTGPSGAACTVTFRWNPPYLWPARGPPQVPVNSGNAPSATAIRESPSKGTLCTPSIAAMRRSGKFPAASQDVTSPWTRAPVTRDGSLPTIPNFDPPRVRGLASCRKSSGDLVFMGRPRLGKMHALKAATGELVWTIDLYIGTSAAHTSDLAIPPIRCPTVTTSCWRWAARGRAVAAVDQIMVETAGLACFPQHLRCSGFHPRRRTGSGHHPRCPGSPRCQPARRRGSLVAPACHRSRHGLLHHAPLGRRAPHAGVLRRIRIWCDSLASESH